MYKVFPATILSDGKKLPLIRGWYESATEDPVQIQNWINQFGDQIKMWGVPTGSANGIIALDVDTKTADKNGFNTIKELNLEVPPTQYQFTPSGGAHFIFKLPEGVEIGNTVGTIGAGLDTRGERGWIALYDLQGKDVAPAPQWFLDRAKEEIVPKVSANYKIEPSYAYNLLDEMCQRIVDAPKGESNDTLNLVAFEAAQTFLATGVFEKEYVFQRLFVAAKERGKPDYEANATIDSGFEGGMKAGVRIECPFLDAPAPIVEPTITRWTPRATTLEDMDDETKISRPVLFKGWSSEDIQILSADGGMGKTTLGMFEAIHFALGWDFLGHKNMQTGRTLFIIGEDDEPKMRAILGRMCRQMNLTREQQLHVANNIYFKKDMDLILISRDRSGIVNVNPYAVDKVSQAVDDIKPKKIIFDPIASFWINETNDEAKAVSKFMLQLRDYASSSVEMINHISKASSQSKDLTQFAGRGGSALPSHARVIKTAVGLDEAEMLDEAGYALSEGESGAKIVISKFTDYTAEKNKPIYVTRRGFCFEKIEPTKVAKSEKDEADTAVIHDMILSYREAGKYPSQGVLYAQAKLTGISKDRVNSALNLLEISGHHGKMIKIIDNPDVTSMNKKVIIFTDLNGTEL